MDMEAVMANYNRANGPSPLLDACDEHTYTTFYLPIMLTNLVYLTYGLRPPGLWLLFNRYCR